MREAVELLKIAVTSSNIRKVAIIDDSFDIPEVDGNVLITFLESETNQAKCNFIEPVIWNDAIKELKSGDDDSNISLLKKLLFNKFIETGNSAFDPGNTFNSSSDNLRVLRPILELLKSCKDLQIYTYGSDISTITPELLPDLVLVDLYLDPQISATDLPEEAKGGRAIASSLKRVQPLQAANDPAIILMSSHGVKGRQVSEEYRSNLGGKVFASRFGFVDKNHILKTGKNFTIQNEARDTLIDIFQTNKFGKALVQAVNRWTDSAEKAVINIKKDLQKLELKEIAYLVQFRLDEEGQGLEEYLEWFFGEALQDHIVREVDTHHASGSLESDLEKSSVVSIDGACEPTRFVAEMYHRVRFENKRTRLRKNFRLGDLYLNLVKSEVYAVMTPECDLVLRKNGTRGAAELFLVPGKIMELEKVSASVGDFLMIDGDPKNIIWEYKKAITRPFTECFASAGQSDGTWIYLGALRPLYAQEIQAHLISHIGRVGVAVPPTIGMHAVANIQVKTKLGYQPLMPGTTFTCSLLHGRANDKKPQVVFDRYEIKKIKEAFQGITPDLLVEESAEQLQSVLVNRAETIERNLRKGLEIDKEVGNEIKFFEKIPKPKEGPWALILIEKVEMSSTIVEEDSQAVTIGKIEQI